MRNKKWIPLFLLLFLLFVPTDVHAFKHGYERKTEEIYATTRRELAVYGDSSGEDFIEYVKKYRGVKVITQGKSWYEIAYTVKDKKTKQQKEKTGWVVKDDFYADCLIYDGREKQCIADGTYQVAYAYPADKALFSPMINVSDAFDATFTFAGNGQFYMNVNENLNGLWKTQEEGNTFSVTRKGAYFSIQDCATGRYLTRNVKGVYEYSINASACWRLTRYNKASDDASLRVFTQYDADWANHYYGPGKNDQPYTNVYATSACGIIAPMNAIYALTGMYADPYEMGDYAVDHYYRILDNGTDSGIFKAVAKEYGAKYGFHYDGSGGTISQLIKKLEKGDVAIAHVPGHYVTIVEYRPKTKKFLILDSHHLPKRRTNPYGDWISIQDLESGSLMGYMYYYYEADRP